MSEPEQGEAFDSPQTKLIVTGEGLQNVDIETLNEVTRALGRMDIHIIGVDESDLPVTFENFTDYGIEQDLGEMALRTWNALMKAREQPEHEVPDKFPGDIYIDEFTLSFKGLDRAAKADVIKYILGIGKKGDDFVKGLIDFLRPEAEKLSQTHK